MKITTLTKGAVILFTVIFLAGCNESELVVVSSEKEAVQPDSINNVNIVTLDPKKGKRIKVGKPKYIETTDKLNVLSHIEVNENLVSTVGANVTGRIVQLLASVGDVVKKGAILAYISSQELTQAQLAYLRAFSQAKLAEHSAERAKQLFSADVIAHAELERRESALHIDQAELSAAESHLHMLNMGKSAIQGLARHGKIIPTVPVTAPQHGIIIESNLAVGKVVQPSDQLFLIADLSTVWVTGDVAEKNAHQVLKGQQVEVYVPALDNARFNGHIVFIADMLDQKKHSVTVRTQVSNKDLKLKPAMLASMHITNTPQIHLVVPNSAVVRENNRDHVFVAQENNRFLLTPVELGNAVSNGMRPVLSGLDIHQSLIVDGAFHANNQRKRAGLN